MLNKRIFNYSQEIIEDALSKLIDAQKEKRALEPETLAAINKDTKQPMIVEIASRIEDFANIIYNNGFDINGQKYVSFYELSDMMEKYAKSDVALSDGSTRKITKDDSLSSLGFFVSQTINRLVTKIDYDDFDAWMLVSRDSIIPNGTVFTNIVYAVSGEAATTRVSEGGEFNTLHLESTEDFVKTNYGKVGVMVTFTEEAARRCGVQVLNQLTEAALIDIRRYKSVEAIRLLESNAKTYFDGLDPKLMPSGRSIQSPDTLNGSLLYRDFEKFMSEAQFNGYNIDVIFVHPLALKIFYREPAIKEYLEKTANIKYLIPKKRPSIVHNVLTKWTKKASGTNQAAKGESFNVPQLLANKMLNVIVTPLVSYHRIKDDILDPATRYTASPKVKYKYESSKERLAPCSDILLIDSSRALTHVHDGRGIITDRIDNRLQDSTIIKFKTYYSFILDKDHGVFAFRNISVTDDVFDPYQKPVIMMNRTDIFPPKSE